MNATPPPTVYVVEDDADVRAALVGFLTTVGLPACAFARAAEFLAAFAADWTGCVLADWHMPGYDGVELVRELRRQQSRLAAILVTGDADHELRRRVQEMGGLEILEKPFRVQQLLDLLRQHSPELFAS